MPGEVVTSCMIWNQLVKASLARMLAYCGIAPPLTVSVEMTKIWLSAKATRCRSWSLPVSTACHHSDSAQAIASPQPAGYGACNAPSKVGGVLNCCASQPFTPRFCTVCISAGVVPKAV